MENKVLFILAGLAIATYQTTELAMAKSQKTESAVLASTLPIADLHMHDALGMARAETTGVAWGGLGSKSGGRSTWMSDKEKYGDRFIAWAGQAELNKAYLNGGMDSMLDPDSPILVELYETSEKDLKAGLIVGIGEIFINKRRRKGKVDAPAMKKFFDLVAKYDGFLAFHMKADSDSMSQLGDLLASNRNGRVIWNHCGNNSSASDVRAMFDTHPNLFCELSGRYPPKNKNRSREIFNARGIDSSWRQLMEDHADRFMVGTDANSDAWFEESIDTVRKGLLSNLSPETASKIAYGNAQRLFRLKDDPGS